MAELAAILTVLGIMAALFVIFAALFALQWMKQTARNTEVMAKALEEIRRRRETVG